MKANKSGIDPGEQQAISSPASPPPDGPNSRAKLPQFFDEADDSMDRFMSRLKEQTPTIEKPPQTVKPAGKTRFAALFGPGPAEAQKPMSPVSQQAPHTTEQPAGPQHPSAQEAFQQMFTMPHREKHSAPLPSASPVTATSNDPDQAGFARILEMLQGRTNAGNPQAQETQSRSPLPVNDSSKSPEDRSLLSILAGNRPAPQNGPLGSPIREQREPDRKDTSQSPAITGHGRQASQQKDEMLLNLLRQASQAPKPTPGPEQYGPRGLSGDSMNRAALSRNQMTSPPAYADLSMLQRRDGQRADEPLHMRYYEDPSGFDSFPRRQQGHDSARSPYDEQTYDSREGPGGNQQQPVVHGPPPGLSRPPGLDQMAPRMPPPGWPAQAPPPPMQHRQPGMPPGMPGPRPNMPPGFNMGPPPQNAAQRGPPPSQAGMPPARKYTGDSNVPPMMGPPPGFMSNQAPPPTIVDYLHQRNVPRGGPLEPQGLGRPFGDMYADGGRNGMRSGAGPMGGYR
jgi:hypothetical protein